MTDLKSKIANHLADAANLRTAKIDNVRKAAASHTDQVNVNDIARLANDAAEAEGAYTVWATADKIFQMGESKGASQSEIAKAIRDEIFSTLAMGSDDSWSGRGNDTARSRFDGVRSAASRIQYMLDV
jgi:hypothetical protein